MFDQDISYSEAKFEVASIVELALWKAKIEEEEFDLQQQINGGDGQTVNKKAMVGQPAARKKCRVKCGADVVLPRVLTFLPTTDSNC